MDANALSRLPAAMRNAKGFIYWTWKEVNGSLTKPPCNPQGIEASAHDESSWRHLNDCFPMPANVAGVGFVLQSVDGLIGIDLDHCRNKETGLFDKWALPILKKFWGTYAEITPSDEGVHIICKGNWPRDRKKVSDPDTGLSIEVYGVFSKRYFTVTGNVMVEAEANRMQEAIDWLATTYYAEKPVHAPAPVAYMDSMDRRDYMRRASAYVAEVEPAVEGQGGHDKMLRAVHRCIEFGLSDSEIDGLLWNEWNGRCIPPWGREQWVHDLQHKISEARPWCDSQGLTNRKLYEIREPLPDPAEPMIGFSSIDGNGEAPATDWTQVDEPENPVEEDDSPFPFRLMSYHDYRELYESEEETWDVHEFFSAGEFSVIAGPSKCLKTGVLADLAVSISTGTPFLDKFDVHEPKGVALITGETRRRKLVARIEGIRQGRGLGREENHSKLFIENAIPKFSVSWQVDKVVKEMQQVGVSVLCIDPAYWALSGDDAGNAVKQASELQYVIDSCQEAGWSLYVCHHTTKRQKMKEQLSLDQILFAGFSEMAGQWMMLNRWENRVKEDHMNVHQLIFNYGGRAGQGGDHYLDVREQTMDMPMVWQPNVSDFSAADLAAESETKAKQSQAAKRAVLADEVEAMKASLAKQFDPSKKQFSDGFTLNEARDRFGRGKALGLALDALVEDGSLIWGTLCTRQCGAGTRTVEGYSFQVVEEE